MMHRPPTRPGNRPRLALLVCACCLLAASHAAAQSFDSGSTGADGALDLTGTPSGTTVNFKPAEPSDPPATPSVETQLGRALNWDDTRFDFTTITIPAGVTLKFSARWTNDPVYFLVQGIPGQPNTTIAVNVAGTISLNGEQGYPYTMSASDRRLAVPGPGGYPGGLGGNYGTATPATATDGFGPGAGLAATSADYGSGDCAQRTSNEFLVPLTGGSGGGGGATGTTGYWGAGGGAGGGAILIASSQAINITGRIEANGGYGGAGTGCPNYGGGGGAGGSIRLAAPILQGNGDIRAYYAGTPKCNPNYQPHWDAGYFCSYGRIRLEAFQHNWTYALGATWTKGTPLAAFVPTTPRPKIRVVSLTTAAGVVPIPFDATGSFDVPDAVINSTEPVEVLVEASQVPPGTIPTLVLFSFEGADQFVTMPALSGSQTTSTTSAQVTFPPGYTRGYVHAKW